MCFIIAANCNKQSYPAISDQKSFSWYYRPDDFFDKTYNSAIFLIFQLGKSIKFQAKASYYDDRIVNISCDEFEVGKLNPYGKYWGIAYEDAAKHFSYAKPRYSTSYAYPYIVTTVR